MTLALLRLLLCAALALLVASLGLNVVLLLRARSFERAYNAERLLPPLQQRILPPPDTAGSIDTANVALMALAGDGVLVLDTRPLLADGRGVLRPEYRVDRLHLSAAGYAALNPALARLLEEIAPVH